MTYRIFRGILQGLIWAGLILILLLLVLYFSQGSGFREGRSDQDAIKVLLMGNSYTFQNDLPGLLEELAASGGHSLSASMLARGGWTLQQHRFSPETGQKLADQAWDVVILQEQSLIPAQPGLRQELMVPAVRSLAGDIRAARARPLLFLTWGRENGLEDDPSSTFSSHQEALQEGYLEIALELDLAVAPVGPAWRTALRLNPELSLWQQDGSHPSLQGSYLAACVFYAVIFDESPLGLEYTAGLAPETAAVLHSAAAQSVLENPSRWNLP